MNWSRVLGLVLVVVSVVLACVSSCMGRNMSGLAWVGLVPALVGLVIVWFGGIYDPFTRRLRLNKGRMETTYLAPVVGWAIMIAALGVEVAVVSGVLR